MSPVSRAVASGLAIAMLFVVTFPSASAEGPTVIIAAPAPDAEVAGLVAVSGSVVSDLEVTDVVLRVDDGAFVAVDSFDGTQWSGSIDSSVLTNGAHVIEVRARDAGGISGSSTVEVIVANPIFFDVRVAAITVDDFLAPPELTVVAANDGLGDMDDMVVRFEYEYQDAWRHIGDVATDVPAGGEATVSIVWDDVLLVGTFVVRVTLDADDAYPEQDESNNEANTTASFYTGLVPGTDPLYPLEDDPMTANLKTIFIEGTGATALYNRPVHIVRVGDVAAWFSNELDNNIVHTATADDGSFDTGLIERGWYSPILTFDEPGTYSYHCSIHPDSMEGQIIVVGNGLP